MSTDQRLRRLLAIVPWVVARDGPELAEVCNRFGCSEAELLDDLNLLFLCGVHPYTPDALIDVDVAEGRVWIRYADYFSRPLRLTAAEGLSLLAAGKTLLATPGADPDGPLARGLGKLAAALGVDDLAAVDVNLGTAPEGVVETVRGAADEHRQVEIEYYSFGRDAWTRRVVDPYSLFSATGEWYLSAYCHQVEDQRLFRIDRIRSAQVLDSRFAPPEDSGGFTVYQARPDDPRVVLELAPEARWVPEQYPTEGVDELGEGRLRVRLAVSEGPWLERLLLRLGPAAVVVEGDAGTGRRAACRVLDRYRQAAL